MIQRPAVRLPPERPVAAHRNAGAAQLQVLALHPPAGVHRAFVGEGDHHPGHGAAVGGGEVHVALHVANTRGRSSKSLIARSRSVGWRAKRSRSQTTTPSIAPLPRSANSRSNSGRTIFTLNAETSLSV